MKTKQFIYFMLIMFFLSAAQLTTPLYAQQQQKVDVDKTEVGAAPMWNAAIGDTIKGTPHLQASSAVLVGQNGKVRSFFMSGTPLWNFDARGTAVPYIARSYEAATYVCNTDGVLMAVNRVGRELWRLNLKKPISYSPVVGWDGRVFISLDSSMTCRTASGNSLWTIDLGSPIAFAPILDTTGSAATVLQNNDFVKVHQFSRVERIRLSKLPVMIVSLDEGHRQSYVLFHQNGEMEKIIYNSGAAEGSQLSRANFGSLPASPVASTSRGDKFAVTLRDGRTLCYSASGSVLWTKNSHEHSSEKGSGNISIEQASMMWDERGIYIISIRGVSAFAPEGRRRFVHRLANVCSGVPSLSDEGVLYATGTDNVLRVYKIEMKSRTIKISKYYGPEPEGDYGMGNPPPSPWTGQNSRYQDTEQDRVYDQIAAVIKSGQIGENEPAYVAYIMEMVGFFIGKPQTSSVRPLVQIKQRTRLIDLLGLVGSRETIPFLWNIFDKDKEPAVKSACAEAIGKIGVDPTGRSFYSYNFLLTPKREDADAQLMISATSSIASLCRFSGPPLAPDGIRVLRLFSDLPSVPPNVKDQVRAEINGLYKMGYDTVIE